MTPTIQVDFNEWRRAAAELSAQSKRTLPDFINGQAMAVAVQAIKLTRKADASRIEYELGTVGYTTRTISKGKRKGQVVKGDRILKNDSLARRILFAHYAKTKKWLTAGATIKDKADNLIKKRLRGVGYIKAGWIPAFKTLSSVVRRKPAKASGGAYGVKQFGAPKGSAIPAKQALGLIYATIENSVPGFSKTTEPYAVEGLRQALAFTAADMTEVLAKRLKQDMARNGMK
jgi:hypothetical protein